MITVGMKIKWSQSDKEYDYIIGSINNGRIEYIDKNGKYLGWDPLDLIEVAIKDGRYVVVEEHYSIF